MERNSITSPVVSSEAITIVELICVWAVSIVVFGFTGWISITKAVELAGWLGLA